MKIRIKCTIISHFLSPSRVSHFLSSVEAEPPPHTLYAVVARVMYEFENINIFLLEVCADFRSSTFSQLDSLTPPAADNTAEMSSKLISNCNQSFLRVSSLFFFRAECCHFAYFSVLSTTVFFHRKKFFIYSIVKFQQSFKFRVYIYVSLSDPKRRLHCN